MADDNRPRAPIVQKRRSDPAEGRVRRDFERPATRHVSVLGRDKRADEGTRARKAWSARETGQEKLRDARQRLVTRITSSGVLDKLSPADAAVMKRAMSGAASPEAAFRAMQAMTRGFGTMLAQAVGALLVLVGAILALAFFVLYLLYNCYGELADPFIPLSFGGLAMAIAFGFATRRVARGGGFGRFAPFIFLPAFFAVWFIAAGSWINLDALNGLPTCW